MIVHRVFNLKKFFLKGKKKKMLLQYRAGMSFQM